MSDSQVRPLSIPIGAGGSVSALLQTGTASTGILVFAHGAGAGMTHDFMARFASALADRNIATLRFQFPFMESGSRRPDVPRVAHAAVRAAAREAARLMPDVPLFAGGKSFGGRMTSQAQAIEPIEGLRGIAFVGFPLHPAGKPSTARADHLRGVALPMLFLQGTRDELATFDLIVGVAKGLDDATLVVLDDADHAFHVRKRSGHSDASTLDTMADAMAAWMRDR